MQVNSILKNEHSPFERLFANLAHTQGGMATSTPTVTPAAHLLRGQYLTLSIDSRHIIDELNQGAEGRAFASTFRLHSPLLKQLVERKHLNEPVIAPALNPSNDVTTRLGALKNAVNSVVVDLANEGNLALECVLDVFAEHGISQATCDAIRTHDLLDIEVSHLEVSTVDYEGDFERADISFSSGCYMLGVTVPVQQIAANATSKKEQESLERAIYSLLALAERLRGTISIEDCIEMTGFIEPIYLKEYSNIEKSIIREIVETSYCSSESLEAIFAALLKNDSDAFHEHLEVHYDTQSLSFHENMLVEELSAWLDDCELDMSVTELLSDVFARAVALDEYSSLTKSFLKGNASVDVKKTIATLDPVFPELASLARLFDYFQSSIEESSYSSRWIVAEDHYSDLVALLIPTSQMDFENSRAFEFADDLYRGQMEAGEDAIDLRLNTLHSTPSIDIGRLWSYALVAALDVISNTLVSE